MMKAPLIPGTRPVGAAQLAVKDTSTDGPGLAATPKTARGPRQTRDEVSPAHASRRASPRVQRCGGCVRSPFCYDRLADPLRFHTHHQG